MLVGVKNEIIRSGEFFLISSLMFFILFKKRDILYLFFMFQTIIYPFFSIPSFLDMKKTWIYSIINNVYPKKIMYFCTSKV